jgi:thiol-disulfide isomerase/thioredoxin
MADYTDFMSAYREENNEKVPRISMDVPTDVEEWRSIVANHPVVVIYMWSEHCQPCLMVRDKFESLAHSFPPEEVVFFKDNIDLPTSLHKRHVEVVPTFFILCDGRELRHPVHKSVHHGWDADILRDAIQYHQSQSQIIAKRQLVESSPRIVCKNNVCYINK